MRTIRYKNEKEFQCLDNLKETPTEIALVHAGRENCKPYHVFSGKRDEYIIHFIVSGRGLYSASGNTWSLSSGQMFLVCPNETVVYCSDSLNPWSYVWIGIKGFEAESILKQCGFTKNRLILPAPDASEYLTCFDGLFEHTTQTYADKFYRESVLLKLLSVLCCNYSQLSRNKNWQQSIPVNNAYIDQAIDYINETYMHGITVSDIANHVGISRTYLNHVFQEEVNRSAQTFLIDYRMHRAARLLRDTSLSVKEISKSVGYNDQLVFSKAFKRTLGVSPREYRANGAVDKTF